MPDWFKDETGEKTQRVSDCPGAGFPVRSWEEKVRGGSPIINEAVQLHRERNMKTVAGNRGHAGSVHARCCHPLKGPAQALPAEGPYRSETATPSRLSGQWVRPALQARRVPTDSLLGPGCHRSCNSAPSDPFGRKPGHATHTRARGAGGEEEPHDAPPRCAAPPGKGPAPYNLSATLNCSFQARVWGPRGLAPTLRAQATAPHPHSPGPLGPEQQPGAACSRGSLPRQESPPNETAAKLSRLRPRRRPACVSPGLGGGRTRRPSRSWHGHRQPAGLRRSQEA